jgi:hypothetical protein
MTLFFYYKKYDYKWIDIQLFGQVKIIVQFRIIFAMTNVYD